MSLFKRLKEWWTSPLTLPSLGFQKSLSKEDLELLERLNKTVAELDEALSTYNRTSKDGMSILDDRELHLYLAWLDANAAYTRGVILRSRIGGFLTRARSSLDYSPIRTYDEADSLINSAIDVCCAIDVFVKTADRRTKRKQRQNDI